MQDFLNDLSELLLKHNVIIVSTTGSIGFLKDCYEKSRDEIFTNRKMINSYDVELIAKENE